jgi:hypothetical protein
VTCAVIIIIIMVDLSFSVPLDKLLIGNEFVSSKSSNGMIDVINPADETLIAQVPSAGTAASPVLCVMTCVWIRPVNH